MFSRREFLMASVAATAVMGPGIAGNWSRAAAQQAMTEDDLLSFEGTGNVTLVHITDIHAQLKPLYFREPSINLGVGEVAGKPPHVTGEDFLKLYNIEPGTPHAYALTSTDFGALAQAYGKMGGLDRVATVIKKIRADRGEDNVLLLDGGDTWQGSFTAQQTLGADMVEVMNALQPDAMTGHWEFTYGADRVMELVEELPFPFLGSNIYDAEWNEPAFEAYRIYDKGGVRVAVVGQAFPYTPIANPRWMFPNWSFGIREEDIVANVEAAREEGADVVVLLSHNGFDVDRKLASRVDGIDVILTGHTHDALPEPVSSTIRWSSPRAPTASSSAGSIWMCAMARFRDMATG
jgi:sulfur-oxidizing protein SoxB